MWSFLPRIGRRRALQGAAASFVALGLLLWWLLPLGEDPPGGRITLTTGTRSGVYQEYGRLLRAELDRDMPDLKVDLQTSDGSLENVRRVATGKADFAIAAADAVETYELQNGEGAARLRGVARLYDDYVQLVVPRESGIRSLADLKGKRVGIGPPQSGVRLIADRVLAAAGIDAREDITAEADGIGSAPGRLESGALDAFFWSGGLPTEGVRALADGFSIRFVPIEADLVGKLHAESDATRYYRATTMPESAYPTVQNGVAVPTLAVSNLLITRADMDPRLTEWVTRTVIKRRDGIGAHVHSAQLVDLRTAIYTDPLKLHDGARNYYQSVKP